MVSKERRLQRKHAIFVLHSIKAIRNEVMLYADQDTIKIFTISPTPTTVCQFKDWNDRIIEIKIHIIKRCVALPIWRWYFRWKNERIQLLNWCVSMQNLNNYFNVFIFYSHSCSFQRKYLFSFQPSPQLKTGRRIQRAA